MKYILPLFAIAPRPTQQGYMATDAINGTSLFDHDPFDNSLFTASGNNTRIAVNTKGYPEWSRDPTKFEGANLDFFQHNLEHVLNRYDVTLNNIYFDDDGSANFELSFCDGEEHENIKTLPKGRQEMVENQYKLYEEVIFPIFSEITAGGIKLQNNGANSLCIGSDKNYEAIAYGGSDNYKKFKIKFAKDSVPDTLSDVLYKKVNITTPVHEALHVLGFDHPHESSAENRKGYSVMQDPWSKNTNKEIPIDKFEINTATSYSHFKNIAINLAHFEYILDPQGPIYENLPDKAKEKIKEFVDKYGKALALGLTPIDIANLQSAYGDEKIADDAKNIITEAGVEYFLFEFAGEGLVSYSGTKDLINNNQLGTYCKKGQHINDLRKKVEKYGSTLACDIDWSWHQSKKASSTEGSGKEGSGTEGSGTEGSGTEGSGTESSGTESSGKEALLAIGAGVAAVGIVGGLICVLSYLIKKGRNNSQGNTGQVEFSQIQIDQINENNPGPRIAPGGVSAVNTDRATDRALNI